ncbi:hypothetical protein EDD17DRAFT_1569257 [Pisolithus thermaeus]|nr:hypothetical protein EV401DRAFT_2073689 [Pisolithus croceorrhizus]KAI6163332.1 hypothetical protein EDD17DRAFT_1569257 [Pisolithus thermaeus]
MQASSSLAASQPCLPQHLYLELSASLRGDIYLRGTTNFDNYSKVFNGDIKITSLAVVCPSDVQSVSRVILFCRKHALSLSVKAGGYGTAGWAVCGDIIMDLVRFNQIEIEPPTSSGGFTSIREMPPAGSKGKDRADPLVTDRDWTGGHRRGNARQYASSLSSQRVDDFLHPGSETSPRSRGPVGAVGPVAPFPFASRAAVPQASQGFLVSNMRGPAPGNNTTMTHVRPTSPTASRGSRVSHPTRGISTTFTSAPSPPVSRPEPSTVIDADPFGYLEEGFGNERPTIPSTSRLAQSIPNSLFANPTFLDSSQNILTYATPIHSRAFITFGAGMRQKDIDQFSAANPLEAFSLSGGRGAVPYYVPFAAHPVGSAVMLLGGFGFLGRLHGLSVDNLVEAEVVLADGRIVIASEREHPDLWWALRGAGSAFGIVTRYKAVAYPVPVVFAGNLIYRFHRATAPSLIRHFRDCVKGAPRELYANVLLTAGPAGQDSLIVIQMCYIGPKIKGNEFLQAISSWDGERCLLNEVDEKSFLHQQDSVAQVLRGRAGNKWFIRSALISSLPDDIINKTVMQFAETPAGCTWLFELAGGAITNANGSCLPKSQRAAAFNVTALHQWDIDSEDSRCVTSAEEWIFGTLAPVAIGGPLPSVSVSLNNNSEVAQSYYQFLGRQEPPSRVVACFGENWARLAQVKKTYDPANFFKNSLWPLNDKGELVPPHEHEPEHIRF